MSEGLFLGGSTEDRVTALVQLDTGSVVAAGVTSPPDFPVTTTAQYGGGASDAFVVELSANLQTRLYSNLLGGSGAEEPLAIATNQFHEILLGGWTNSADFPVNDPLPSSCGRGPEDGFLVYLDASFQTMLSTCYGGTGSDRTNSVGFGDVQRLFIGGTTDSPDLPLKNAMQAGNAGELDGFFAEITVPVLHANDLSVGKDLSGIGYAQLGDSSNYVGVPLTVTSTDPARVLLSIRPDDPGQGSITISNGSANDFPGRNFRAGCLVDNGKIAVRLSAPGYPSKSINVSCLPSALYIGKTDLSIPPQGQQGSITVVTAAFDPVSQAMLQVQNPRGGLDPIRVDASTSNPNVQLGTSTVTIDSLTSLILPSGSFNPNAISFQMADLGAG